MHKNFQLHKAGKINTDWLHILQNIKKAYTE